MKAADWFKDLFRQIGSVRSFCINLGLIVVGSVLCCAAVNGLLIPHQFVSSGMTGALLLIKAIWSPLPLGWSLMACNVVLFSVGWRYVGKRFLFYSIIGATIFTLSLEYVKVAIEVDDDLLATLLAGILTGLGSGLILRSHGSAGGSDIIAVIMLERFSIRLGSTTLAFNSLILLAAGVIISLEGALYTLVFIFVTAQVTDLVVTGLSKRKVVHIITPHWPEVMEVLMKKMKRGATLIPAVGGYSGASRQMIFTVITFREVSRLKRLVKEIDPDAFLVVSDTMEVMGLNIGNQPNYSGPTPRPPRPELPGEACDPPQED